MNGHGNAKEKDTVKVYLRVRPLTAKEKTAGPECISLQSTKQIHYRNPKNIKKVLEYEFDHVFGPKADQIELFQKTAFPLVTDVLRGQDALLFTYGITNSGKTYTMQGSEEDLDGIMPRTLDVLFNSINNQRAKWFTFKPDESKGTIVVRDANEAKDLRRKHRHDHPEDRDAMDVDTSVPIQTRRRSYDPSSLALADPDTRFSIFISYVEIYRNYVYDLFDDRPMYTPDAFNPKSRGKPLKTSLGVKLGRDGQYYVQGATWKEVHSTDEAFRLLEEGKAVRKVGSTNLNSQSSRSHSIFTIKVVSAPLNRNGSDVVRDDDIPPHVAQICLVDLAGSERCMRSGSKGNQQKEGIDINKSLNKLRECFQALRDMQQKGKKKRIQYREFSLTHLFQKYLMGHGKMSMIVCASPSSPDAAETASVLDFAKLTGEIETNVSEEAPIYKGYEEGRGMQCRLQRRARRKAGGGETSLSDIEENDGAEANQEPGAYSAVQKELEEMAKDQSPSSAYRSGATVGKRSKHLESPHLARAIGDIDQHMHKSLAQKRQQMEDAQQQFRTHLREKENTLMQQTIRISELTEQLTEEKLRCDSLEKKTEELIRETAATRTELESHISEQKEDIERLTADLSTTRRRNESLEREKAELESQLHAMRRELSKYEGELREKDQRTHMLTREYQEKSTEHKARLDRMAEAVKSREEKVLMLKERMERARDRIEKRAKNTPNRPLSMRSAPSPPKQPNLADVVDENVSPAKRAKSPVHGRHHRVADAYEQKRKSIAPANNSDDDDDEEDDQDYSRGSRQVLDAYADDQENVASNNIAMTTDDPSKPAYNKVYNHVPQNHKTAKGTILQNHNKHGSVARPELKGLKRHDYYVLNHADSPNKQSVFKGPIMKSISKEGYSVRLTGEELLRLNNLAEEANDGVSPAKHFKSAGQFAEKAVLSPMKKIPRRRHK
ncbi:hypothetical protein PTSG_00966 [Salpingoeca rosetta]|uniref:Kinesin-like protein n=1 Tax=Salpingoeca rosetta (strain ATCC 50818 / BSB-021) TaxID=946362 RepID=F2TY04_SALR5|nr:uncharacterized protein PTSG_00966 [Salpingoeca rosetta]EGD76263.1 hypothetical protein PTSG_00966 [Salpingoeca rosetta]|eukprot:XP_004998438.1 hypothetical protein PTSG_00966 [Salpingoeca rosetta]